MASKIGLTPFLLARDIVRFYTFLRASRDAARPLGDLKSSPPTDRKHLEHIHNVLIALSQVFRAAEKVLGSEFSPVGLNEGQDIAKSMYEKIDVALASIAPDT